MRRLGLVMLVMVGIVSCDRNEPAPRPLVTYSLEITSGGWMFASDADGKILDYKKLEFNTPVSLSAVNPPDTFNLTLITIIRENPLALVASTYGGITPGSVFTPQVFDPGEGEQVKQEGKVEVQVTNYPEEQELPLIVADQFQSTSYSMSGTNTPTFRMSVWQSKPSRFLITGYKGDLMHPVYQYIDTPGVDGTVAADFDTFTPFENTFEIKGFDTEKAVQLYFTMFASIDDYFTGTQLADIFVPYTGASPTSTIGYLDDIDSYYFSLGVFEGDQQLGVTRYHRYTYRGPLTQPVVLLDDQLTINKKAMPSFAFNYSGKYEMVKHVYNRVSNDVFVQWNIYTGPGDFARVKNLPGELLALYPDLDPNTLTYLSSSFYRYFDGYTYKKFVEETFTASYGPAHPGYEQTFFK